MSNDYRRGLAALLFACLIAKPLVAEDDVPDAGDVFSGLSVRTQQPVPRPEHAGPPGQACEAHKANRRLHTGGATLGDAPRISRGSGRKAGRRRRSEGVC